MKKGFSYVLLAILLLMFLAWTGPVRAYTVTGDLSSSGSAALAGNVTSTGSLSALFDTSGGEALYINNGSPYSDMYANNDYIIATSTSGAWLTFSVGEITVGNNSVNSHVSSNANNITITGNSTIGYTITGPNPGQVLNNLANIDVVHTGTVSNGNGSYASSFTVQQNGTTLASYNSSNFPGTYTQITGQESWVSTGNAYTGVSLLALLNAAGINTSNLNQYVIATGSDLGSTVLSMAEIVQNNGSTVNGHSGSDMVAYLLNGSLHSTSRGYARLVLPSDTSNSRSIFTLTSLDVVATPIPAALLLFAPGLAGLVGLRKRFVR